MARFQLILALLLLSSTLALTQGSSIATATPISPNGSGGGTMSDVSTQHYWKVTTTVNGYLRVQLNSGSTIDCELTLYDVNGTSYIVYDGQVGTYSEVFRFLKPGTYYIYVNRYSGTSGSYTMTTSFASPSRAADPEPNDTYATASTLSPTGTATGQIGYFGGSTTDTDDYWKITTTQDGWLRVQVRSDSVDARGDQNLDLDLTLYDVNGTSYIVYDGRYGFFSEDSMFVRPGTYYALVQRYAGRAGSYEIKADFFPPPLANDVEGNDTHQTASQAVVNGSVTGHLGYFSNGTTDTDDYWKFTISGNGKVTVQVTGDSLDRSNVPLDLDLTIYDVNGTSYIVYDGRYGKFSECVLYLRPATYYALVHRYMGQGGSYTLKITHTAPARANDVEGNDWFAYATPLTFNVASTGHLGYFSNNYTDSQDYWRLVAPSTDSIYVHVTSDSVIDLDLTAYAPDTVSSLLYDGQYGIYSRVGIKPTTGAAYYFRVNRWSGTAGAYSIIATRSSLAVGVEKDKDAVLIPHDLALEQNYPNPFNPSTTIRYSLPEQEKVRVSVYSVLGQEIAVLVNSIQSPSTYTVNWNGRDHQGVEMPSGVYLIRLQAGDKQIVKKAMLVR